MNDGESVESWDARRARLLETANNGNGAGQRLTIQAKRHSSGRLNPRFVEWLMGWPDQHTAIVPRIDRLRILGNGVVPAQAELALKLLNKRGVNDEV